MTRKTNPNNSACSAVDDRLTVAEALAAVAVSTDIPAGRRRTMTSALHALARLEGKPPEVVRLDPISSLDRFEGAGPAKLDIGKGTTTNYRTALRQILRRVGLLAPQRTKSHRIDDGAWCVLLVNLPQGAAFRRLRAFAGHCATEGIAPGAVGKASLEGYCAQRAAERGGSKARDHGRRVASQWNNAAALVPGWPATRLGVTGRVQERSPPFETYPGALQVEVAEYLAAISGNVDEGLFTGSGRRPVKPSTAQTRRDSLRRLLWGAVEAGMPIDSLASLRIVTTPAFVERSLEWHYRRKGNKVTADLGQLAATVVSIAHHLGLPEGEMRELKELLVHATPEPRTEILPRTAALLDALSDPKTRGRLLHLPSVLTTKAARLRDGWIDRRGLYHKPQPVDAGWLAGIAAAIEILLHAPVRRDNLGSLRLGDELRLVDTGRGRWRGTILIGQHAVKNRRQIEFPLGAETVALLRTYIDHFRPALPNAASAWLFPGAASDDKPRNKSSFGTTISETVEQHVGVRVNPHAFRAFAGALILEASPHAIDDVRAVLGHDTFATALIYYRRNSQIAAAERLSDVLSQQRRATRLPTGTRAPMARLAMGGRQH